MSKTNRNELTGKFETKHNMSKTRIYSIWAGIKNRCYNKNKKEYDRYGGKGLLMCDEWKEDFVKFYEWSIENGYSDDLTIDRIDNTKGYYPDNCRWTDYQTQTLNRSVTKYVDIDGEKFTIPQLSKKYGINKNCLYARVRKLGYTKEIIEPVIKTYNYKGKEYRLYELAKLLGISEQTLYYRIKSNWNINDIDKQINSKTNYEGR